MELRGSNTTADKKAPKLYTWSAPHYSASPIVKGLQSLLERRVACDVVLKAGSREFSAHKLILSAISPYFECMFCGELREATEGTIVMHDIDPGVMKAIIDYCYYSKFSIDEEKVMQLACTAGMMQIPAIQEGCCQSLARTHTEANCMERYQISKMHHIPALKNSTITFMGKNLRKLSVRGVLLDIEFQDFESVIKGNALGILSEIDVFNAIVSWCKHDWVERKTHFEDLFKHVKIGQLSSKELTDCIEFSSCVKGNRKIKASIHAIKKNPKVNCYSFFGGIESRALLKETRMFAMGGSDGDEFLDTVERYDGDKRQWIECAPMKKKRSKAAACTYQSKIYICGGTNKAGRSMSSMERFDCDKQTWTTVRSLDTNRSSFNFVECQGWLYAFSGCTTGGVLTNTTEKYDPERDVWTYTANLSVAKKNAAAVSYNGFIYSFGGEEKCSFVTSCERYSPRTSTWDKITELPKHQYCEQAVEIGGLAYLVGPTDIADVRGVSISCFDLRTLQWLPSKRNVGCQPLSMFSVAKHQNRLIVLGGQVSLGIFSGDSTKSVTGLMPMHENEDDDEYDEYDEYGDYYSSSDEDYYRGNSWSRNTIYYSELTYAPMKNGRKDFCVVTF